MENEIKQIISDVSKVAITKVHEDAELGNDLAIDSLDLLDVVTELEKKYQIDIPAEDMTDFITVKDIITAVQSTVKSNE
ncbi:acyl carrier protein [Brochothrix thermosphacta]|uniref:Putative acyl carrier protein, PKS/NRPS-like protein n=1 Tax=Brochothrix thermosphacta TaxID=2756 RepID=A0A2X0QVY0_BROTH|nr:acyl carrier protein [Brochothrix thermosphacta]SPP28288.1 putative acyl carrier protein, PKS/NRPS-like protein [Brochothrix thermosphacta]